MTQVYTYIHSSSLQFIPGDWIQFLVLYSRTSLVSHSKCNSLHLRSPTSWSTLLPPPLPLGDWARRGPASHAGPPVSAPPAWGSQCEARERSDGKGGGRGLAEAASASPRFAAPNWLPSPACHDAAAQLRALKARGCSQFPAQGTWLPSSIVLGATHT